MNCFCIDREAFTITNYDLNVRVEPEQHRVGVRGRITLRNDSQTPQRVAVLQISFSLDWRAINAGDKPLQFVSQPYSSDVDHTGALSEAVVTLPQAVAPKGAIDLDIAYEGVIVLDATRLMRIGTPDAAADSSDWDQISVNFTGVRGAGYVAWYPIATESANLSEGDSLFEVLGRWKEREKDARMELSLSFPTIESDVKAPYIFCDGPSLEMVVKGGSPQWPNAKCSYQTLGTSSPTFVSASYGFLERSNIYVYSLPGHDVSATNFADAAEKAAPLIADWFGQPRERARVADLPDPKAAPFESGTLLLTPLASTDSKLAGLAVAHQLTHAAFQSFRPWIEEGLAHFAQALYLEHENGRQAALDYMSLHRSAFVAAEKPAKPEDASNRSLANTNSEEFYRSKAMCVWWMLRDMAGDAALKKALASYHAGQDKEPSYMPRLIAAQTQRDLEWFFDDWVYRDRGLPDFKIASVFPHKTMTDTYTVTVTVDNLGAAGAEVPVIVKFAGGEVTKRVEVRGKSKGVVRVEVPAAPREVVVNDGSVPESDMTNNVFTVEAVAQ